MSDCILDDFLFVAGNLKIHILQMIEHKKYWFFCAKATSNDYDEPVGTCDLAIVDNNET